MVLFRHTAILILLHAISVGNTIAAPGSHPIAPPKSEVRAVWVTTAAGLDWPRTLDRREQQESLRNIVLTAKQMGFNTIFFQVRPRGDTYFRSKFEPWADRLTGTTGKDPGWDPLATLLVQAHAVGMDVHAWFNVFKIRGPNPVGESTPRHPSHALAAWCVEDGGEIWLDPGRPEVRTYLVGVVTDLVRSYDIDGLNFDFVRYPGAKFDDGETFARFGKGMNLQDWRRANVTAFVREAYKQSTAIKPRLRIGSSPLGVYRDDGNHDRRGSFYWVFQDSYGWLKEGINDYLSPQIYWMNEPWNREPPFHRVVKDWKGLTAGRHVYAGIAAYRPEIQKDLGSYIDSVRSTGLHGEVFFRWENLLAPEARTNRYRIPANIPPMPWKDPTPPMRVTDLTVEETAEGIYRLYWSLPPRAADGDTALYYNVYRWTNAQIPIHLPESRIVITRPGQHTFLDSTHSDGKTRFYYAVTAFDRSHNESPPSPVICSITERVIPPALAPLPPSPPKPITLGITIEHSTGKPTLVQYSIPDRTRVAVDIIRRREGIPDTVHSMLVRAVQDGGTYAVSLSSIALEPGAYTIRLTTAEKTIEQQLRVGP
jgi:uncharacterized lipoprotein YddW (UPF0748 family)